MTEKATSTFDYVHPVTIKETFSFLEFVLANKKSVYSINSFLSYSQFKSPVSTEWPHRFLTIPSPIFFNQLLISLNLYQYAKNQAISIFCYRNIFNFKILQSDWPRTFWSISQEPDFPEIWDLHKNIKNNINFHYRPKFRNKLMVKVFIKFKTDGWTIRQTNGQTQFQRTLPATTGVPKSSQLLQQFSNFYINYHAKTQGQAAFPLNTSNTLLMVRKTIKYFPKGGT